MVGLNRYVILVCCHLLGGFSLCFGSNNFPEVVNTGIFHGLKITSAVISAKIGGYYVYGDGKEIYDLHGGQALQVVLIGDSIGLQSFNGHVGNYHEIRLYRKEWGNSFQVKLLDPSHKARVYPDNLFIRIAGERMRLVNNTYLEHYIAGVVESEAGRRCNPEYYKVQAIICRTFALAHLDRHLSEGINLCDKVHCQAFHGKCTSNPDIKEAAFETKGMVLVDSGINLITAAYHSNCGGYTANSEEVWREALEYLRERSDTFCLNMPNAHWERQFGKQKWLQYLKTTFKYPIEDSLHLQLALHRHQQGRERYLSPPDSLVAFTQIRKDQNLPSALFNIMEEGDQVVLSGRGYGHGVGLCQEGAMKMSESGYSYSDILHYYYMNVHLINLSAIEFFREE